MPSFALTLVNPLQPPPGYGKHYGNSERNKGRLTVGTVSPDLGWLNDTLGVWEGTWSNPGGWVAIFKAIEDLAARVK